MTGDQNTESSGPKNEPTTPSIVGSRYAWYVLIVLVIVYVFNFIDRTILSILAEEIKADIGITDAQLGFLYGTAFSVFYAVFGIPLARLADVWTRTKLISIGLFFWSLMTTLSGTARGMGSLAAYRIGVGVGESSASPAAFSMLGDYFPQRMRATAVAIYSSGVYIGSGIGLFLGGWILEGWQNLYPEGGAPFDLVGWQAAFIVVGLPGLFMAIWVWTLREPVRGQTEGITSAEPTPSPLPVLAKELAAVIPPFTLYSLAQAGAKSTGLLLNVGSGLALALAAWGLTEVLGTPAQWWALALGIYCVTSWVQALALRDRPTFVMIYKSKTMVIAMIGFGLIAFRTYGIGFWLPPFFFRFHDADPGEVGTYIGLATAFGGWIGVTGGGILSDWLKTKTPRARLYCGLISIFGSLPLVLFILTTRNTAAAYVAIFFDVIIISSWIGSAIALANELVLPRMRATASAFYILLVTFIGLAMGPYTIGRISDGFVQNGTEPGIALRNGMLLALIATGLAAVCFIVASFTVTNDEKERLNRARAAGEEGI